MSAIWLTPLLDQPVVLEGLTRVKQRTMLIGGTGDATWHPEALASNAAIEVVQLDGLDHSLQRSNDVGGSVLALKAIVETMERFVADALPGS